MFSQQMIFQANDFSLRYICWFQVKQNEINEIKWVTLGPPVEGTCLNMGTHQDHKCLIQKGQTNLLESFEFQVPSRHCRWDHRPITHVWCFFGAVPIWGSLLIISIAILPHISAYLIAIVLMQSIGVATYCTCMLGWGGCQDDNLRKKVKDLEQFRQNLSIDHQKTISLYQILLVG